MKKKYEVYKFAVIDFVENEKGIGNYYFGRFCRGFYR